MSITEKSMNNPISKGVDGQLRDPEKVLPGQIAFGLLIQASEPAPEPLDLISSNYN